MGTLVIENTGDHPKHPKLANYRYRMTGPINGGEVGKWHEGTLRDVDRDKGYWAAREGGSERLGLRLQTHADD
jgi:hypothetical protein